MSLKKDDRGVIRLHDTTDHGGEVIQVAHSNNIVMGRPVACVGDLVKCPKCDGIYKIIEGDPHHTIEDDHVAYEGHTTECGAKLISSV